jgi:hypothetical protein
MIDMGASGSQVAESVTDHIKKEILAAVPARIDQLSSENVEILRSKLHILHYYCLQKGCNADITRGLEATLETSQGFWELLASNASALADLNETYKMRWLDLGSGVLTELEEIISGEESFRDVIVNSIAILLAWKADTVWVDMAKEDRKEVPKVHMMRLEDELWKFICEASRNGSDVTLEKAAEIGEKMSLLLQFMTGDNMPVAMHVMLLSQIYILLLRLNLGKTLMILEKHEEDNP